MKDHVPGADILELVESNLAYVAVPSRIIWRRGGYWSHPTIRSALLCLVEQGRAERTSDMMRCGSIRHLYRAPIPVPAEPFVPSIVPEVGE